MVKTSTEREVDQEGSLREGLEAAIRERVREIIELVLEEEVEAALGAPRSQRVAERNGYRHGRKSRRLTLHTGTVRLAVPRARLTGQDDSEREWHSQLVPRYRRSSREVEQSVLGVYLAGTNTRRIRGALEPLLSGAALSKSAVSRLVLRLEESYRTWQQRDLTEEKIVYLYLDAIYPKVRSNGRVVSLPVLVALGVRENGEKVLLSLMTAGSESAAGWQMSLAKWKRQCPGAAASLEEAGEELLTFFQFPASQWVSLRTTNAIERMQLEFRRRVKTQAALPNEGAVLRVFFGLWVSGQMKLRRIRGYRDIRGTEKEAA